MNKAVVNFSSLRNYVRHSPDFKVQNSERKLSMFIHRPTGNCLITVPFITGITQRGVLGRNITTAVEQYYLNIDVSKNIKYVQHIIRSGQGRSG